MKKKYILVIAAVLLLACLSGCGEKEPEEERIRITMENFREYFEFTVFADWDDWFRYLKCGWELKKEYADRFVATPEDDPLEAKIRRREGGYWYRVEWDSSDPARYTVGEPADRRSGECVGWWQLEECRDPATGETRYGFFHWGDDGTMESDPTCYMVLSEEDFVVEDVLGSLILKSRE